jgi:hypothetical protein
VVQLVEVLLYQLKGREFEFFIDLFLSATLWLWLRIGLLTGKSKRDISWEVKAAGA